MMPWSHNLAILLAGAASYKNSDVSAQPGSHNGDSTSCKKNNRARTKQQNDATEYLNDLFVAELGRYKHKQWSKLKSGQAFKLGCLCCGGDLSSTAHPTMQSKT